MLEKKLSHLCLLLLLYCIVVALPKVSALQPSPPSQSRLTHKTQRLTTLSPLFHDNKADLTLSKPDTSVRLNPPSFFRSILQANPRREIMLASLFALIGTIAATTVPLFFSKVLQALIATEFRYTNILRPLGMMLLCHMIEPLMTILYVRQCTKIVDNFICFLRESAFHSIISRSVASFDASGPSDSTQLLTNDVDRIKQTLMQNISRDRGIRAFIELLIGITICFSLCTPLALMFSVIVPITSYLSSQQAKGFFAAAARENAASLKQAKRVQETLSNFKEVVSFSNQQFEERRFQHIIHESSQSALASGFAKAVFEASNRAGIYANIITMFAVGGYLVGKKVVPAPVLVSFIGYCWSLNFATQGLLLSYGDWKMISASWQKVSRTIAESTSWVYNPNAQSKGGEDSETLASQATVTALQTHAHSASGSTPGEGSSLGVGLCAGVGVGLDASSHVNPVPETTSTTTTTTTTTMSNIGDMHVSENVITERWNSLKGQPMSVDLINVNFSYPNRPDVPILKDVVLSIKPGTVTALVGPSGAGKSTIASLLNRFYDVTGGTMIVDGVNSSLLSKEKYLQRVSVVRQSASLFTDTIAANIAYGAQAYRTVTQDEIIQASKAANAHNFIMSLPEGYQTRVGDDEGCVQLSGGQKQRVAIARAIIKNASLLVLDESTSALDSESEALVQESLTRLMKGRTTVVVAHRLSTVISADQIAVVKDGQIAEIGTHHDLMKKKGFYHSLMSTQLNAFEGTPVLP